MNNQHIIVLLLTKTDIIKNEQNNKNIKKVIFNINSSI